MKRARVSDGPRNNMVRLNVGGKVFQTSRETLSASGFFASLLDFDGDGGLDKEGNVFVDRDPKLFQVILNSLRTARRPNQLIINLWKHELLAECRFYATESVAARIMGRTHVQISTLATYVFAPFSVVFSFGTSRKRYNYGCRVLLVCVISEHARVRIGFAMNFHIARRVRPRKKRRNLQVRRTCDDDLSPYCRIITIEEKERRVCLIDVFDAGLKRKDVADLQLPELLLSEARAREPQDRVLAGDHCHCKEALNVSIGGILLALEQDPLVKSRVVVAGGAVLSALTGCSSGTPRSLCLSLLSLALC